MPKSERKKTRHKGGLDKLNKLRKLCYLDWFANFKTASMLFLV